MDIKKLAAPLLEEYELFDYKLIKIHDEIQHLKDAKEYKCRFCQKEKPEVKFKSKAHLIPEFFGNKTLFSLYECDNCNKYFGTLESEFANFMLPYNTITGTKGKNGIPKYKKDIEIITSEEGVINVNNFPRELSDLDKQVDLTVTHEYIPDSLYRALIKICLSIVDEKKYEALNYAVPWILNKEKKTVFTPHMLFKIYPFGYDQKRITAIIFKKKTLSKTIPTFIFSLSYKNFSFQTHFPENEFYDRTENYYPFPFYIPNFLDFSIPSSCIVDEATIELSSTERVKHKSIIHIKNLDS